MNKLIITLLLTLLTTNTFAAKKEIATYLRNTLKAGTHLGHINRREPCKVVVIHRGRTNYFDVAVDIQNFQGESLSSYVVKDSTYIDGYGDCPRFMKKMPRFIHIKNFPFAGACLAEVGKAHDQEIVIKKRGMRVDIITASADRTSVAKCSVSPSILK